MGVIIFFLSLPKKSLSCQTIAWSTVKGQHKGWNCIARALVRIGRGVIWMKTLLLDRLNHEIVECSVTVLTIIQALGILI